MPALKGSKTEENLKEAFVIVISTQVQRGQGTRRSYLWISSLPWPRRFRPHLPAMPHSVRHRRACRA